MDENDLVYRLRKRAEIRRSITTRKSVQEGKPDRIADLLEEAAREIAAARNRQNALRSLAVAVECCPNCPKCSTNAKTLLEMLDRMPCPVCKSPDAVGPCPFDSKEKP